MNTPPSISEQSIIRSRRLKDSETSLLRSGERHFLFLSERTMSLTQCRQAWPLAHGLTSLIIRLSYSPSQAIMGGRKKANRSQAWMFPLAGVID